MEPHLLTLNGPIMRGLNIFYNGPIHQPFRGVKAPAEAREHVQRFLSRCCLDAAPVRAGLNVYEAQSEALYHASRVNPTSPPPGWNREATHERWAEHAGGLPPLALAAMERLGPGTHATTSQGARGEMWLTHWGRFAPAHADLTAFIEMVCAFADEHADAANIPYGWEDRHIPKRRASPFSVEIEWSPRFSDPRTGEALEDPWAKHNLLGLTLATTSSFWLQASFGVDALGPTLTERFDAWSEWLPLRDRDVEARFGDPAAQSWNPWPMKFRRAEAET